MKKQEMRTQEQWKQKERRKTDNGEKMARRQEENRTNT